MANRQRALRAQIVPAWQAFVAEVLPAGSVSRAAAAVNAGGQTRVGGVWYAKTPNAAFLRRVANGGVAQPEPETVWFAAEAARTLDGRTWCAGPLFLFASGHFVRFVHVILSASSQLVSADRKRSLIDAAPSACRTAPIDAGALERRLREAGISEIVIKSQARRRRTADANPVRPDRNAWVLTPAEEAAFTEAYLHPIERSSSAVAAAELVELRPDILLQHQHDIVCTVLRSEVA